MLEINSFSLNTQFMNSNSPLSLSQNSNTLLKKNEYISIWEFSKHKSVRRRIKYRRANYLHKRPPRERDIRYPAAARI